MEALIQISQELIGAKTVNSVNARELYQTLEIKQEFANWIKRQIKSLGLEINVDFITIDKKVNRQILKEYIITTDTAKHISMASRTSKGKEVRNYFIAIEKAVAQDVNLYELNGRIGGLMSANNNYKRHIDELINRIELLENKQKQIPNKKECVLPHKTFGRNNLLEFIGAVQREQQDMGEILSMLIGHHKDTSRAMNRLLETYPEVNPQSKSRGYAGEFINININL